MEDLSSRFENLMDKVENLLIKYSRLKEENRKLAQENAEFKGQMQRYAESVRELEHKLEVLKAIKSLGRDEEERAQIRSTVNDFIREIDRCLAMLNT